MPADRWVDTNPIAFDRGLYRARKTMGSINLIMTNLLKLGKKIFTVGVVSTTVFWSLGVAAFVPAVANAATETDCATLAGGDMVKVDGKAAIWAVNSDKTRSYFANGDIYKSWTANNLYTFKTVSGDCMASLKAVGAVFARPGTFLVKESATDKLYVTLPGNKLAEISADAAKAMYGATYLATPAKGGRTLTMDDATWVNYSKPGFGTKVTEVAPTEGSLVKMGSTYYVVVGTTLREVTSTGMTANRFQAKFAYAMAATTGFTMGSAVTAQESALSDLTQGAKGDGSAVTLPSSGPVAVSLSASTPAGATLPQKATGVEFLKFNVTSGSDTTLNDLVLHRIFVGAAGDFANVYVYDGNTRLTSGRTVASDSNKVIFSNLKVALAAGQTKTLTVVADLSTSPAGNDGFEVVEANGSVVSGVKGNEFVIGGSAVSKVTIDNSGTSGTFRLGQSQAEVARGTINAGSATYDVSVKRLVLTNGGSMSNSNLTNLKLTIGSTDVATAASMTGDKVIFALATPYVITKGNTKTFTVYADNVGGRVADTVAFYVDQTSDASILDGQYNLGVSYTNASTDDLFLFASGDQTYTVTGGDLTLANNGPVSQNIGKNVTNVTLQKFSFSANNNVTVKKTKVWVYLQDASGVAVSDTVGLDRVKNVKIVDLDAGNQTVVGPQSTFGTGTTASGNGFYKVFTDTYDINAGKTRHFAVLADIDTNMTSSYKLYTVVDYSVDDTYVKYVDNSQFVDNATIVPNTLTGNTMTVSGAQLTVTRATPPASASVVKGSTQNALGLLLTAGTSDDLKITSLKLRVFASTTAINADNGDTAANAVVNTVALYEDGAATPLMTKNLSDLSGTIGSNGYYYVTYTGLNYKLAAGASKKLVAVLGLKDSLSATRYVSVDLVPSDDIDVEKYVDGGNVTENSSAAINASSPVYLTVTTGGSVTIAVDGSTPLADVVLSGSPAAVAMTTYKLRPTQENFTLVGASVTSTAGKYVDIKKVVMTYKNKAGETVNKDCYLNSSDSCTFSDGQLDAYLLKDQDNLITLSAYFNTINDGAVSGDAVMIGFTKVATQFGASASTTNDFILLGEGSNTKQYGADNDIVLLDSAITAKTVRKTNVVVAESDTGSVTHSTKAQDAIGVFTFTSTAEAGSNQNSTLGTLAVKLTGNLIGGTGYGDGTVAIYAYNGSTFDAAHLMNTTVVPVTSLATSTSDQINIVLQTQNEWSGARQVYLVVNTTDDDFNDSDANIEKLTAQLVTYSWGDGSATYTNVAPVTGIPLYGKTYQY